jgi:hypothetical protein
VIPAGQALGRRAFWAIVLVALALRLVSFASAAGASPFFGGLIVDDRYYHEWALRIASGELRGAQPFFLAPLLPYLLGGFYALVGEAPQVWIGFQLLLSALTAGFVSAVASRAFGRRVGIAAGLMAASYGPLILFAQVILSETLHLALVWGALVLLVRPAQERRPFCAGLLAGLAALARNYFVLGAGALVLWVWFAEGRRAAGAMAAGVALALAPATLHNLVAGEVVLVTASGGANLYVGNHPGATGRFHVPEGLVVEQVMDPAGLQRALGGIAAQELGHEPGAGEASSFFTRRALGWAAGNPGAFALLVAKRARFVLEAREFPAERNYTTAARFSPVLRWTPGRWPLLLGLGVAGLLLARRRLGPAVPVLCAGGAALAVLLLFWVTDRFRLPLVPGMCVFAGVAVDRILHTRGRCSAAVVAVGLALVSVSISWGEPRETYMSHYNLGLQYLRREDPVGAEAAMRTSVESAPEYLNGWVGLHQALVLGGKQAEAAEARRTANGVARRKGLPPPFRRRE